MRKIDTASSAHWKPRFGSVVLPRSYSPGIEHSVSSNDDVVEKSNAGTFDDSMAKASEPPPPAPETSQAPSPSPFAPDMPILSAYTPIHLYEIIRPSPPSYPAKKSRKSKVISVVRVRKSRPPPPEEERRKRKEENPYFSEKDEKNAVGNEVRLPVLAKMRLALPPSQYGTPVESGSIRTLSRQRHEPKTELIEWPDDRNTSSYKHSNSSLDEAHVLRVKEQQSNTGPSCDLRRPRDSRSVRKEEADMAMYAWFPPSSALPIAARKPFNEADIRGISDILCRIGRESWSRIPRIYATLRIINQLSDIDCFLDLGLSDMSLPFNNKTLPMSLQCQATRSKFLEAQKLVLTKALDLERENGKHRHFSNSDNMPFQRIAELGKGGFSYVDRVRSTISYKDYARKLIPRGRTFCKDQEVLSGFERELATLKKLSHRHIVELVGSYTDPKYVGIILSPVADCNLKQFLSRDPLPPESRSFLSTFFGCLTSALRYLHENSIRHKDVKPQNVLVKSHQVFLTDFGISRDWAELGHSTTEGPSIKTLRYCAPEVAAERPRNSSSDIWSLGCVFLEIWSVLCGETLPNLVAYMESSGSKSTHYYQNTEAISSWCDLIRSKSGDEGLDRPYVWITSMMKETPKERWIVQSLFDRIQEANVDPIVLLKFSDHCCIEADNVSEDAQSSVFEHDLTDATKVSMSESWAKDEQRLSTLHNGIAEGPY